MIHILILYFSFFHDYGQRARIGNIAIF